MKLAYKALISFLIAAICAYLTGCAKAPAGLESNSTNTFVSQKITGNYIGSGIGAFLQEGDPDEAAITSYESVISREVAVVMWFRDFQGALPVSACNAVYAHGAVPMIAWEPWRAGISNDATYSLDKINDGTWDTYITQFADDARSLGKPIFIRFAHEMNIDYYPWSGNKNGFSGAKYIEAWRHIWATFEAAGATNVTWVWCPNSSGDPYGAAWNTPEAYYPGDQYVDWIGIDGYNYGTTQSWSSWQTFYQIFDTPYHDLISLHPSKPFMIGEMSSTKDEGSYTKAAWITDTFYQISHNYANFKLYTWFNLNKECSWEVDVPIECRISIEAAMQDTYYLSGIH